MTDRELMQMAMETIQGCRPSSKSYKQMRETVEALRDRLAQPEREWVGLTDEEIYDYADKFLYQHGSNYGIKSFGKAIEATLKEKNA